MKLYTGGFIVISFLIGWGSCAIALANDAVTFDNTFSLSILLSIASTVATGLIVGRYIQTSLQEDRTEKDLLLKHLTTLNDAVMSLETFTEGGPLPEIRPSLKRVGMSAVSVRRAVEIVGNSRVFPYVDFLESTKQLRSLMTETELEGEDGERDAMKAQVHDDRISWTAHRGAMIASTISEFKAKIVEAQLFINKM